jgi:hypothetical protein
MIRKSQISDEVEKTLQAYDGDIILEDNPFLLTRIQAGREYRSSRRKISSAPRISLSQILMLFIILINLVTFTYNFQVKAHQNLQENLVTELETDLHVDQSLDLL